MTPVICFAVYLIVGAVTSFVWPLIDDDIELAICAGAFWFIVVPGLILGLCCNIIFIAPANLAQKIKESKEDKK